MNLDKLKVCRVCGWDHGDYTWGQDGKTASFEICDCCGTEFGYEDVTLKGILKKRAEWIERGTPWTDPKERPEGWDYKACLGRIPKEYFENSEG